MNVPAAAGQAMGWIADQVGGLVRKVNPDVWRELAYVSLSSYSLLLPKRETVADRRDDGLRPIVLVHGLGGNRGTWSPLRLFLRLNGRRRIYAFGYEQGTVEVIAERLKDFVEDVLRVTNEKQVDIVAHSLGGIISRYAIQRLGLKKRVRTFVTMATPHLGTYAAFYANTDLTRPLRPESDLIRDLNADDLSELPLRFVSICSDRDVYVVPKDRMMHPCARNIFIPGLSHSQHLFSLRVFRSVADILRETAGA